MEIKVTKKTVINWVSGALKGFLLTTGFTAILSLICQFLGDAV